MPYNGGIFLMPGVWTQLYLDADLYVCMCMCMYIYMQTYVICSYQTGIWSDSLLMVTWFTEPSTTWCTDSGGTCDRLSFLPLIRLFSKTESPTVTIVSVPRVTAAATVTHSEGLGFHGSEQKMGGEARNHFLNVPSEKRLISHEWLRNCSFFTLGRMQVFVCLFVPVVQCRNGSVEMNFCHNQRGSLYALVDTLFITISMRGQHKGVCPWHTWFCLRL